MVTIEDLEAFGDGWNRHDVDFLMTFMTDLFTFRGGKIARKDSCFKNRLA